MIIRAQAYRVSPALALLGSRNSILKGPLGPRSPLCNHISPARATRAPGSHRIEELAMAKTRGTGLLMVWTDIDPEFEAEFNQWYDEEHIARLLQVPGFLNAGRYVAVKGAPKYLAMYELEDHNVLRSTAYLDSVKYQPSPQRAKTGTSRIGRNFLRNAYRQIFPVHTNPIEQTVEMAPFLQMGRIDISSAIEEEFNAWYNTAYIPGYLAVPGCLGARRFVAVEGQPKYLTVYEFEHARVSETEAWSRARVSNPWTRRVQPNLRHDDGSPGVYQRIYPK
jgi:antibiotic biosynthesis monooxygenase (ABM) superfamily enzyme